MRIGIILNSNDAETCWNCFRFANEALAHRHGVKVFLLSKGVELDNVQDEKFPLLEATIKKFTSNNGTVLACGTCLKLRDKEGSELCPISTMAELVRLVEESERIVTFG